MRPPEISREEIIAAGELARSQGVARITGYALRRMLNNRGNPNRLGEIWADHVAQGEAAERTPALPIPDEVESLLAGVAGLVDGELRKLVGVMLLVGQRQLEQAVATERRLADDQAQQRFAELREATDEVGRLDGELSLQMEKLAVAETARNEALVALQAEKERAAQLQERCSHFEQHNSSILAEIGELRAQLVAGNSQVQELRIQVQAARTEAVQLQIRLDAEIRTHAELGEQLVSERQQHITALDLVKGSITQLEREIAAQKEERDSERKRVALETHRNGELLIAAQREAKELRDEVRSAHKAAADAEKALARAEGQIEALQAHGGPKKGAPKV